MTYRRILTIQDLSCVGQCSMAVALPVLSAWGHEVCPLPARLFSTHTGGFGQPAVWDSADFMEQAAAHWRSAGITFDVIYTGYLGSVRAIRQAEEMIDTLLSPGGKVVTDPAMADHGKLYAGLDEDYARAMGELCAKADVMLPNLTEAAMMTGCSEDNFETLLHKLAGKNVVLTGIQGPRGQTGIALRTREGIQTYLHKQVDGSFFGTGDLYAACFTGAWAAGKPMFQAAGIAADFVCRCVEITAQSPSGGSGVKFAPALWELIKIEFQYKDIEISASKMELNKNEFE